MKQLHFFSVAAVIAMAALPAIAQQQATPAAMPAMAASMPMDCPKAQMKSHDHGAERGMGPTTAATKTMGMHCGPEGAASGSAKARKKGHDHGKFHKGQ